MILGLWDTRENSATKDVKMKIVMGNGVSRLVLVPRGVAHGVVNVASTPGTIFYVVNNHFTLEAPDEHRISWDRLGSKFWEVEKG
jgi:dTDP-4-dehydrorhamnose 3,5-epimerase-like enzyme